MSTMTITPADRRLRAQHWRDALRYRMPRDLYWGINVIPCGNVFYRGVLVGRFTPDWDAIIGWGHRMVPVNDDMAVEALFRGVFFPWDYRDARTAVDRRAELMAAYAARDAAAVQVALRRLRALEVTAA